MSSNWIKASNGALINVDNILQLKVNRTSCSVVAECVSNRTIEIEQCEDRDKAIIRCHEIAGIEPPAKKEVKKPATKKAPAKK